MTDVRLSEIAQDPSTPNIQSGDAVLVHRGGNDLRATYMPQFRFVRVAGLNDEDGNPRPNIIGRYVKLCTASNSWQCNEARRFEVLIPNDGLTRSTDTRYLPTDDYLQMQVIES